MSRSTSHFYSAENSSKTEQISFPATFLSYKKQHLSAQGENSASTQKRLAEDGCGLSAGAHLQIEALLSLQRPVQATNRALFPKGKKQINATFSLKKLYKSMF